MYIAIKEVGGYKPGEVVPEVKALAWLEMYGVPHVKEVTSEEAKAMKKKEEPKPEEKPKEEEEKKLDEDPGPDDSESMLDDYLGRNTNVVAKSIKNDDFEEGTLGKMLEKETEGKNRRKVRKAIESKMKESE